MSPCCSVIVSQGEAVFGLSATSFPCFLRNGTNSLSNSQSVTYSRQTVESGRELYVKFGVEEQRILRARRCFCGRQMAHSVAVSSRSNVV